MKFICDDNLGKLAKYLRILGFDTAFNEHIDNNALLRLAALEERILLTRDRQLEKKTHPFGLLLFSCNEPIEQLKTVVAHFTLTLDSSEFFKRCSICNEICTEIDKSLARDEIFPYILATQEIVRQCPRCRRYYWKGSHYSKIIGKLGVVLAK